MITVKINASYFRVKAKILQYIFVQPREAVTENLISQFVKLPYAFNATISFDIFLD